MWARLILSLITTLPGIVEDLAGAIKEMHSNDPTGTKAQKAADVLGSLAAVAAHVVGTLSPPNG